jgi:hypothetical protein
LGRRAWAFCGRIRLQFPPAISSPRGNALDILVRLFFYSFGISHFFHRPTFANYYHLNRTIRLPAGSFVIFPLASSPEQSAVKALFLTIKITFLKQNIGGLPD